MVPWDLPPGQAATLEQFVVKQMSVWVSFENKTNPMV
jgi:hypothetical protein